MAISQAQATVRNENGTALIDLSGDINATAEGTLNSAYAEASAAGDGPIVLNFSDVSYINSTGIALIVGILASARKAGRTIVAYGLSDHYREIFEITRLADFMKLYPDEQSALADE